MKKRGYLYVAMGGKFLTEATRSIQSLLKVDPNAEVTLVTDSTEKEVSGFNNVIFLDEDIDRPYLYKIKAIGLSPYDQTFYIDSDTYFCDCCTELFELLNHFDMLIGHCNSDYFSVYDNNEQEVKGIYPYNTGVIVFKKNEKTVELLNRWYNAYRNHFDKYVQDQAPFIEALLLVDIKMYVFPTIYNARTPYPFSMIARPVKIIHGRHKDYAKIAKKLNQNILHSRIWFPRFQLVIVFKRTFLFNWYMSLGPSFKAKIKKIIRPVVVKFGLRDYI
jgi:hypothetical protein